MSTDERRRSRERLIDETLAESFPASDPPSWTLGRKSAVEVTLHARVRDVAGFAVRRALPTAQRRRVGPFVFLDHMGPVVLAPGQGIDVKPHPHIGLATITYLFEGELVHRDSLGSHQTIRPGDVNWMVAGRGVAHSERSGDEARARGGTVHGVQVWVGLPEDREESAPSFEHHEKGALPTIRRDGVTLDVIAGTVFGTRAPTSVLSPTMYAHGRFEAGATLSLDDTHEERAFYVVEGSIACDDDTFSPGDLVIVRDGAEIEARQPSRVMLIGGAKLGERHMDWNFVSSSRERIERARDDWQNDRFPKIPGDDGERVPLPARGAMLPR